MWKNLKIRGKLLSAFCLLLLIFAVSIGWSWKRIGNVKESNISLANNNVPTMLLNAAIDRDLQSMYLAMRTYQYKELASDLNTIKSLRDKVQKEIAAAQSRSASDPSLTGLKRLAENVVPSFQAYIENVDKVFSGVSTKNALYGDIEVMGKELDALAAEMLKKQYNELRKEASLDESRILRRLERLEPSIAIHAAVIELQGKIRSAAARGDVEAIQSTEKMVEDIVAQCKALRQITTQESMKAPWLNSKKRG